MAGGVKQHDIGIHLAFAELIVTDLVPVPRSPPIVGSIAGPAVAELAVTLPFNGIE